MATQPQPPKPGMLVRGRYLWHEQDVAGREHAPYSRPCLIIDVNVRDGRPIVDVLPLSSKPQGEDRGFALPPEIARRFGLGERESYVITQEKNVVEWSSRFTEPIRGQDTPVYGHLTPGLTRKAITEHNECRAKGTARTVEQSRSAPPIRDVEHVKAMNRQAKARGGSGRDEPERER